MKKTSAKIGERIETLIMEEDWPRARKLILKELAATPEDHWLITRLGLTYYEERDYRMALQLYEKSFQILSDCPLTIWNLAGALDMLGKSSQAAGYYRWIIDSKTRYEDDSCWESREWTESMKASSVYRLAGCEKDLGHKSKAIELYRSYIELLVNGVEGVYSFDDVKAKIQKLQPAETNGTTGRRTRKILKSVA